MNRRDYKHYKRLLKKEKINRIINIGAIAIAAGITAKYICDYRRQRKYFTYEEIFNSYSDSQVYFIGGGLASLAGAAYLIRDCGFKGENIHIIEGLNVLGGSNDGAGCPETGFICRGGRMLNEETYENFWDLFSSIPSLEYPDLSVTEEILNFDYLHPTHAKARLVDKYGDIVDVSTMGFNKNDRLELFRLMMTPESTLDDFTIEEWFNDHFFETNFWYMWQTTFAFQKWSSLFEFKRYMNRMIFEFTRIETLEGVTRTPYNQYESVILPLKKYLEEYNVDFMVNTKVTDLDFKEGRNITVTAIHIEEGHQVDKKDEDINYSDDIISDIDNLNLENEDYIKNKVDTEVDSETKNQNMELLGGEKNSESENQNMNSSDSSDSVDSSELLNATDSLESSDEEKNSENVNEEKQGSALVDEVMRSLHIVEDVKEDLVEGTSENLVEDTKEDSKDAEVNIKDSNLKERIIYLKDNDKCIMINGCMTDNATLGDYYTAPVFNDSKPMSAELWEKISKKKPGLGCPKPFFDCPKLTNWESFTVTCKGNKLLKLIEKFSKNIPGSGALMTFKDSSWLMSIVVAAQPHFTNQPIDTTIFWGYGLYTHNAGDYIKKPMKDCTGEEILTELLYHLHLIDKKEEILKDVVNVIPCMMPYITSQFQPRKMSDRPEVVPEGSTNFAMISQFVEIPEDMVFTEEYSVRAARTAVYTLFNVQDNKVCPVTPYNKDPKILLEALKKSFS